jgi:hypothetical protein
MTGKCDREIARQAGEGKASAWAGENLVSSISPDETEKAAGDFAAAEKFDVRMVLHPLSAEGRSLFRSLITAD